MIEDAAWQSGHGRIGTVRIGHGGGDVGVEVDKLTKEVAGTIIGAIVEILPVEARFAVDGLNPVGKGPGGHWDPTRLILRAGGSGRMRRQWGRSQPSESPRAG